MRTALVSLVLLSVVARAQVPAEASHAPTRGRERDRERDQEREFAPDDLRMQAVQRAVQRGLEWLVAQQASNGSWTGDVGIKTNDNYRIQETASEQARRGTGHMGVSALAGLALLAGGNLPDRGPFGKQVRATTEYVLSHVQENGFVTDSGTNMYSHAFATLFLAQVHGMAKEKRIRVQLERAVQLIVDCQNAQGAWRYYAFSPEADLSVTVCQLQALRAAYNIGVQVPKLVMDRAVDYVKRSRTPRGGDEGLFFYKIRGRGAYEKNHQFAINAAAVTSLFSAGVYDEALYGPALTFVTNEYPHVRGWYGEHFYYWYGNYYAVQAMYHAGGERYRRYWDRICDDLLSTQQSDGRWINSIGPGDVFATAIACLILELPWQFLPIFQR